MCSMHDREAEISVTAAQHININPAFSSPLNFSERTHDTAARTAELSGVRWLFPWCSHCAGWWFVSKKVEHHFLI